MDLGEIAAALLPRPRIPSPPPPLPLCLSKHKWKGPGFPLLLSHPPLPICFPNLAPPDLEPMAVVEVDRRPVLPLPRQLVHRPRAPPAGGQRRKQRRQSLADRQRNRKQKAPVFGRTAAGAQGKAARLWQNGSGSARKGSHRGSPSNMKTNSILLPFASPAAVWPLGAVLGRRRVISVPVGAGSWSRCSRSSLFSNAATCISQQSEVIRANS